MVDTSVGATWDLRNNKAQMNVWMSMNVKLVVFVISRRTLDVKTHLEVIVVYVRMDSPGLQQDVKPLHQQAQQPLESHAKTILVVLINVKTHVTGISVGVTLVTNMMENNVWMSMNV
jgi:hypothetical protein